MCVCVCVFVCARTRMCVCVCVCIFGIRLGDKCTSRPKLYTSYIVIVFVDKG